MTPIKIIKINKDIEYREGKRFISIKPSTLSLDIDFKLKYNNNIIRNQKHKVKLYKKKISKMSLEKKIKFVDIQKRLFKLILDNKFLIYKHKKPKKVKDIVDLNNYVRLKIINSLYNK